MYNSLRNVYIEVYTMKTFNDYAEKAIVRFGLTGYNNLAREIGITKASMSIFRAGKAYPSEETFLKIVELAGLPKEEALIDLNLWRSKDKPEVQKIWQRLSKMIGCFIVFSMIFNTLALNSHIVDVSTKYILCIQIIQIKSKRLS